MKPCISFPDFWPPLCPPAECVSRDESSWSKNSWKRIIIVEDVACSDDCWKCCWFVWLVMTNLHMLCRPLCSGRSWANTERKSSTNPKLISFWKEYVTTFSHYYVWSDEEELNEEGLTTLCCYNTVVLTIAVTKLCSHSQIPNCFHIILTFAVAKLMRNQRARGTSVQGFRLATWGSQMTSLELISGVN